MADGLATTRRVKVSPAAAARTPRYACVLAVAAVVGCLNPKPGGPVLVERPARGRQVAQQMFTAARDVDGGRPLTMWVLPSGLSLLLEEDPHATAAGVVTVITGGSGTDPVGSEGLAHLVEHLTYRAVDPAPPGESPATRWNRLGRYAVGDMNGFTTQDWLMFYEFAPTARLPDIVDLALARLLDPLAGVDDTAFALERQVVGSEHLLREDPRAGGWAARALVPLIFPAHHPYARPVGGSEETRRALTLPAARAYAEANFRPERTTLLVTAPPGTASLVALVERLPPSWRGDPEHPVARVAPVVSQAAPDVAASVANSAAAVRRQPSPMPTPELWLAWSLPGAGGEVASVEEVLARWLQQDLVLGQLSNEENRIRHIDVQVRPGVVASVLQLRVLLAQQADADRVAELVTARVTTLWERAAAQQPVFMRLRLLFETRQLVSGATQWDRTLEQALASAQSGRPRTVAELQKELQTVSIDAVAGFARRLLTRERARAVLFSPLVAATDKASAMPSPAANETSGVAGAASASDAFAEAASWPDTELPVPANVPAVSGRRLANGLTVLTARRPGPTVVAWLGFRGGYSDAEPPLLVELVQRARPEALAASRLHMLPGRGATRDLSFDTLEFLRPQLTDGLALLFAKATAPLPEWPKPNELQQLMAPLAAVEDVGAMKTSRAFWRALLGEHPRGRGVDTADIGKLNQAAAGAWMGRVHDVRNAVLVVVGDVEPEQVHRAAEVLSRRLSARGSGRDWPPAPAVVPRTAASSHPVALVNGRRGSLTALSLGCLLPAPVRGDHEHLEILQYAVDARLNAALRLDHGDGYGVEVAVDRLRGGVTYLIATTFVPESSVPRTLETLRHHWQRWGRHGFDSAELNMARRRRAAVLPFLYGGGHALAMRLMSDWNSGWAGEPDTPPASGLTLGDAYLRPGLAGTTTAQLGQLFATCKANAVLSLSGNEAVLRRALERSWSELRR